jgi:hypothetical protein
MEEEKVVLPDTGEEIQDRRQLNRRADDRARPPRMGTARAFFWALIGSVVVLYLFFVAIGGIDPDEARAATIAILVLALAWLAHSWRRLWAGGFVSRVDRERRGF